MVEHLAPAHLLGAERGDQHFCGKTFFQHRPPIDPSSLTRWRGRIGEEGVEWLLTKTIEAGREAGVIRERSAEAVIVDTTVMEKAISPPPMHASTRRPASGS